MDKKQREALVARFEAELETVQKPGAYKAARPGIDALLAYIRKSDFYTAPASAKNHLATEGGLLQHSLNVLDALRGLLTWDPTDSVWEYRVAGKVVDAIPDDSVTITALLHDICKANFYSIAYRNVKNERTKRWEKAPYYTIEDKMPLGHGDKSAMILKEFIPLTKQELYAIWWHMGMPETYEGRCSFNAAVTAHPFIWALHTADMMASHFMEAGTENKPGFRPSDLSDETGEATMDERLEADAASGGPDYQEAPPAVQEAAEPPQDGTQSAAVANQEGQAGKDTTPAEKSACAAPVSESGGTEEGQTDG